MGDDIHTNVLLASLIHELRQPLMGARTALQLFERKLQSSERETQEWHIVKAQLDRFGALLDGYKELLQPGDLPPVAFAVDGIVDRVLSAQALRLSVLGERFIRPAHTNATVRGRPQALEHALGNLLINALDAVETLPAARLQISLTIAESSLNIRFSDEGVGIAPAVRAKLFSPRVTTKGDGGTGLGLFIARHVLDRTGGNIALVDQAHHSVPWASTEFSVTLPLQTEVTALVVEDEESLRYLLGEALRHDGYTVSLAATCEEAYAQLANGRFDVVLTDKNLPDGSGVDVATRARERDPKAAIVLATGYANSASAEQLVGIIDAYVEKPFDLGDLSTLLRDVRKRRVTSAAVVVAPKRGSASVATFMPDSELAEPLRRDLRRRNVTPTDVVTLEEPVLDEVDVLFVALTSFTEMTRKKLLDLHARRPHLAMVTVSDTDKLSDRVNTILIGAVALLVVPWTDRALDRVLAARRTT